LKVGSQLNADQAGLDPELRLLRFIGHSLPSIPHASGVVNRILKPFYLRKPRAVVQSDVMGLRMELDPTERWMGNLLFCPQLYDPVEVDFLMRHLDSTDAFVDVGAHIGFYLSIDGVRAGIKDPRPA